MAVRSTALGTVSSVAADAVAATTARWLGWRLRLGVLGALVACASLFALVVALSQEHGLPAQWRDDGKGGLVLAASTDPRLTPHLGRRLQALAAPGTTPVTVDALLLQHSPRWCVDDDHRAAQRRMQQAVQRALDAGTVELHFDDAPPVLVPTAPRGVAALGVPFWLLAALALVLALHGQVAALTPPARRQWPHALMVGTLAVSLLLMAVTSVPGLGTPLRASSWALPVFIAPDLVMSAAAVHAATLHPRPAPRGPWLAAAAWAVAGTVLALAAVQRLPSPWWATQATMLAAGATVIVLLARGQRRWPHPMALVFGRVTLLAVATLALLTLVLAAIEHHASTPPAPVQAAAVAWYVFFATLLLLVPLLSRTRALLREFALAAAVSTVATALDLLFVAVFALGPFASLTLALFFGLAAYVAARQWLTTRLLGRRTVSTDRVFEQLYRAARDIEAQPAAAGPRLRRLLQDLFEPIEIVDAPVGPAAARVVGRGSALLVPLPTWREDDDHRGPGAVVLRYAQRGQRLFTPDDARLADRLIEQLRHAVAHDRAVEQGRREERARLAQDLHDDIGARLLTLMYQAPTREMEDYVRHTLQDLKTLTRGLAVDSHRLSDAAAEWRTDLGQRLQAAGCQVDWSFTADREVELGVVAWSALTRLLRELVSNAIVHARATRVDVVIDYGRGRLRIDVADDGVGRAPASWSPGLGLAGIRKRVRQLGGDVAWVERQPRGIRCEVRVPSLGDARPR